MPDQQPNHSVFADAQDSAIVDDVFGTVVTWEYEGCPHYCPRQQLDGVVLDVRTRANGVRQLLVKSDYLNLPHWVNVQDVQFVKQKAVAA